MPRNLQTLVIVELRASLSFHLKLWSNISNQHYRIGVCECVKHIVAKKFGKSCNRCLSFFLSFIDNNTYALTMYFLWQFRCDERHLHIVHVLYQPNVLFDFRTFFPASLWNSVHGYAIVVLYRLLFGFICVQMSHLPFGCDNDNAWKLKFTFKAIISRVTCQRNRNDIAYRGTIFQIDDSKRIHTISTIEKCVRFIA